MRAAACALLAVLLAVGLPAAAHAAVAAAVPTTVSLVDSAGAPLAGAQINYYASGGSWQPVQVTGADGAVHLNLNPGTYTFQATWYGGSQQLSLAVDASHTTLTFHTLDVSVPVLDSQGAGIAGAVQNVYGSTGSWVGNRTTGATGDLHYELLVGSYHFQATWNGGSQQQTLTVDASHTSLPFQTLDVSVPVLDSQGAGIAGVVENFYGSTGSWVGNRTTGATGDLHYELLVGSYHFQATWNGGSQQLPLTVDASHTALTFTTFDARVALLDSQDAGISGAVQNFYGSTGSWVGNRTTGASGILHYELLAGSYTFQTTSNGGSQQLSLAVDASHTDLTFRTLDVAVSMLDSQGSGIAGSVANFYGSTGSWVGNRTTGSSGVLHYELLAGAYHFQETYNGGSQQLPLAVDATHTTLAFTAMDIAVSVLDSQGTGISGAVVNFYGSTGSWVGNRTTGATGDLHYELLVGSYHFQATYSGGSQQLALTVAPGVHELTFTTRDVSVSIVSSQGAGLSGATVNFYGSTGSWVGNRASGSSGLLHYELLPGAYAFQATYKGGSQQQPLTVGSGATALTFTTSPVTALVVDAAGAPVSGASINHYGSTGSWVGSRQTNSGGQVVTELLPGSYSFRSTRWGTMSRSLTVPPSVLVTFAPSGSTTRPAPPSPPGVAATAAITPTASLHWNAIAAAVTYRVYRGATLAGTTTETSFTDTAAPDGTWAYTVVAVDVNGVASAPSAAVTVTVDTTPPATHVTSAPGSVAVGTVSIEFSADADAVSTACSVDGGAFAACTSPWQLADLTEGDHTLAIRATDGAGNVENPVATVHVTVDATPPARPTLTATPATDLPLASGQARVLLSVLADADAVRVVVRREGDVIYDGPVPGDLTDDDLHDETTYHYSAVAYDAAGNTSAAAAATADTPDRTAPAAPAAPDGSGYPLHVTWPGDAGTTYTLDRDGTAIARTAQSDVVDADAVDNDAPEAPADVRLSGLTRTGLTVSWGAPADHGTTYRYAVHGEDASGNVGLRSPEAELVARSGVAEYLVLVNGVATGPRTADTSLELTGLPAGVRRTITVVAVDGAGNGSDPSGAVVTGDDETLAVPADLAGTTPTREKPALTWTAVDDAVSYVVFRDGHELARVTEPSFTDEHLAADGTYAYAVASVGAAGLPSDPSDPLPVVYDTTAPETAITAGPADGARVRDSVTFSIGPDEDGIIFACTVDDAAPVPCTSPWLLTGLGSGPHRVTIAATDAAGNVDATPVATTFTVDLTAPAAPSLTAVADATLPAGSAQGRVGVAAQPGEGGSRVVVTEGARLVLDSAGGSTADDVPDGAELTYRAVSYDEVGNPSDATSVTVRTPDRTAPAAPQITGATGYPLVLHWTMEGGATATVRRGTATVAETSGLSTTDEDAVDTDAPAVPDGVVATAVTTDGFDVSWAAAPDGGTEYLYTATVRDDAGNVSPPAPATPATATSGTARYRVLVDGAVAVETDATHAHVGGLDAGSTHDVAVVAVDAAGNASAHSPALAVPTATRSGTPPPSATILGEPVITRPHVPVRLKVAVTPGTAPVATVVWHFRDGTTANGTEVERTFRTTGAEVVRVSATDAGGGEATGSMVVVVDGDAPSARIDGRTPNGIVIVGSDDLSGVESLTAHWSGGSATAKAARLVVKLPASVTTVDVTGRDRAGNVGRVTLRVQGDRLKPALTVTAPALSFGARAKIKIGAPGARLLVDGKKAGGTAQVATGKRHVVEAVDKAGNRSRVTILIPRDRPIAGLKSPALDGPRSDELWPSKRDETGVRRYLLRAAEQRLVIAGALPAKFKLTNRFTPAVTAAVRAFQTGRHLAASGKIDAKTKAALDRAATAARTTWSAR